MGMRLIIKERKKLQESERTEKSSFQVAMSPYLFLELTLPKHEYEYTLNFIEKVKLENIQKDSERLEEIMFALGKQADQEYKPRSNFKYAEIARNVIDRAIALVRKEKNYDPNKAAISLNIMYGSYNTFVMNHSGRATCLFAILCDVEEITCIINGISKEQLKSLQDAKRVIISQDLNYETSKVPAEKIKIK